jgi:hypothetical protein
MAAAKLDSADGQQRPLALHDASGLRPERDVVQRLVAQQESASGVPGLSRHVGQAGLDPSPKVLVVGPRQSLLEQGPGRPDLSCVDRFDTPPVEMFGGLHPLMMT